MKVYSTTSKTGTDFEVYRQDMLPPILRKEGMHFEFIIDDGTLKNYGIVTLGSQQILDLIGSLETAAIRESGSRCGCTEDDACGEWNDGAALKAYRE